LRKGTTRASPDDVCGHAVEGAGQRGRLHREEHGIDAAVQSLHDVRTARALTEDRAGQVETPLLQRLHALRTSDDDHVVAGVAEEDGEQSTHAPRPDDGIPRHCRSSSLLSVTLSG
jgi:hypothetical protein